MRNKDGRYDLRFEEWVVDGPFVISPRISFEVHSLITDNPGCEATYHNERYDVVVEVLRKI